MAPLTEQEDIVRRVPLPDCQALTHNSSSAKQCNHFPSSILELPFVLSHPVLPSDLRLTATLLATSKAVAAAATAARGSQLQQLCVKAASSRQAKDLAAWNTKHARQLQGLHTLKLTMDRAAIEGYSRAAGSGLWGLLYRHINRYTYSTATASVAACILQSMPKTLSKVILQLQSNEDVTAIPLHEGECVLLRPALAGLSDLQSISIAGPGAAACLPKGPSLTANLSQLTSLRLGTIRSAAGVAELLSALPASLLQLCLDIDTPDRLQHAPDMGDAEWQWLLEQQRAVQMPQLTALTTLHVTGRRYVVGRDSKLPPNIINLTVPMVLRAAPLLQLTGLQRLSIHNLNQMRASDFEAMARCLTQLTHLETDLMVIEDDDAPEIIAGLAHLPLKKLCLLSYGMTEAADS
jgi:hypothetical protein